MKKSKDGIKAKDTSTSKSDKVNNWLNKRVVPVLQVVSANKFLRSLMSGFYTALPIIIFSSIIGIIMWVPPAFAGNPTMYPLELRRALNRIFSFTMGFVALFFCAGIARTMAEKINQQMPGNNRLNVTMVMFAAIIALFMLSITGTFVVNPDGSGTENFANLEVANLGAQGMLTGIIVGLSIPWVFYIPVRYGWTIKLPKAVPQGVSQAFADIIPLGLSVLVYWGFGYIFIYSMGESFTDALFAAIKPIFSGLDSYGFLAAVAFMTSMIWFIGVHGPSVTRPFLTAFMYTNLANNQQVFAQGGHPTMALTYEFSYDFTSTLGGTGATFVVPTLLILFAKSKQLKAVGIASYIPIWFQVNEPALFGCPLILNPLALPAFIIAPILNVLLYKFFIVNLGMNGAVVDVPWSIPAILGLMLGTGLKQSQPFFLWSGMILIDLVLWLPCLLVYDKVVCKQELETAEEKNIPIPLHFNYFSLIRLWTGKRLGFKAEKRELCKTELGNILVEIKDEKAKNKAAKAEMKLADKEAKAAKKLEKHNKKNFPKGQEDTMQTNSNVVIENKKTYRAIVICYGAGTSAMFANSATKGAQKKGYKNIEFLSSSYGNHYELIKTVDLIILSPQVKVYAKEIAQDVKNLNAKVVFTTPKEYIACTNDIVTAIDFVTTNLPQVLNTENVNVANTQNLKEAV